MEAMKKKHKTVDGETKDWRRRRRRREVDTLHSTGSGVGGRPRSSGDSEIKLQDERSWNIR